MGRNSGEAGRRIRSTVPVIGSWPFRFAYAGAPVGADGIADTCLVSDDVDGVDHLVRHGGEGAGPVAGQVGGPDGLHGVAEAGPGEAVGVGIDDGMGEQADRGWRSTPARRWELRSVRWRSCSGPGLTSFGD
jgi:hypothetical protein